MLSTILGSLYPNELHCRYLVHLDKEVATILMTNFDDLLAGILFHLLSFKRNDLFRKASMVRFLLH